MTHVSDFPDPFDDPRPDPLTARILAAVRAADAATVVRAESVARTDLAQRLAVVMGAPVVGVASAGAIASDGPLAVPAPGARPRFARRATASSRPGWWRAGLAASAAMAGLFTLVWMRAGKETLLPARAPLAMQVASTAPGQRARLQLADGTVVHLSVASTLRYPADFGPRTRTVELDGEAMFEVRDQARTPFIVRSGGTATQVLGTVFDVRHYAGDTLVRVTVASGKVRVASDGAGETGRTPHIIIAGQTALAARGSTTVTLADSAALSWVHGSVSFRQVPVREVVRAVERWYDVRIAFGDASLGAHRVTTTIGKQSLDDVVRTLSVLLDARVVRSGDTVTFLPR